MSRAELIEKIESLPTPLLGKVEELVEVLVARAALEEAEDPFFGRVEALRLKIEAEHGTFPGALSHLRNLRNETV